MLPSLSSPINVKSQSSDIGNTLCLTSRSLLNWAIESFSEPVISNIAVKIRFPTACPSKSLEVLNLYDIISLIGWSIWDKFVITFLISPTAGVWNSSLNFPVDLPLSDTVITAVISTGKSFNKYEIPVPPPNTTTFLYIFSSLFIS